MNQNVITMILKNGTPTGIIQCNLDEWIGISYKIPRAKIKEMVELKYINNTGIYILFGIDKDSGKNIVYIGETEDICKRLLQHNKLKEFWNECVLFASQDNSLNKAHIKFIENLLYVKAKTVGRYIIENDEKPTKSSLDGADEIRAIKFYEKIMMITSIYGHRLFDEIITEEEKNNKKSEVLYLKNNNIDLARGIITNEGFVILKGSKLKKGISDGISPSLLKFAERERSSDNIMNGEFVKDYLCTTPSMAAVIILGRNSNGYTEWKNKEGKKLREII